MQYEYIDDTDQLGEFCSDVRESPFLTFDTEFVSEDTYRPQLCLIQVAADGRLAVIDPLAIEDVAPFWQLLAAEGHQTIVHAGREEFRFCLHATGHRPTGWFDIQIAAAFVGMEYPAAYGTLISKLLGKNLPKGETRTDWRRRPLSKTQIEYALQDVVYLKEIHDLLSKRIDELGRSNWLVDELLAWQDQIEQSENTEQWRRVSGISNLSARQLAIVRELWRWRDAEAQNRNSPPKRVLRDDLIVELARRKTDNLQRIKAVRGMEHRRLQRELPNLAECVRKALELPESSCPATGRRNDRSQPQLTLLGQFLNTALGSICRSAEIASSLVGSVGDIRELVAYRLGISKPSDPVPGLAQGWRAEIVGRQLDQLLAGKTVLRVTDPLADQPVSIEAFDGGVADPPSSE